MGLYWILSVRNSIKSFTPYFSGTVGARILRLGIHMDNELLNCGIENRADYSHSFFFLSIRLFQGKVVSQFSQELCKLISSSLAYLWGLTDCTVALRLSLIAIIFSTFLHTFLSFLILDVNDEYFFCSGTIEARVSKNKF